MVEIMSSGYLRILAGDNQIVYEPRLCDAVKIILSDPEVKEFDQKILYKIHQHDLVRADNHVHNLYMNESYSDTRAARDIDVSDITVENIIDTLKGFASKSSYSSEKTERLPLVQKIMDRTDKEELFVEAIFKETSDNNSRFAYYTILSNGLIFRIPPNVNDARNAVEIITVIIPSYIDFVNAYSTKEMIINSHDTEKLPTYLLRLGLEFHLNGWIMKDKQDTENVERKVTRDLRSGFTSGTFGRR